MRIDVMADRALSVDEIAKWRDMSKDAVHVWISERNMLAHRSGLLWKFKTKEAHALV